MFTIFFSFFLHCSPSDILEICYLDSSSTIPSRKVVLARVALTVNLKGVFTSLLFFPFCSPSDILEIFYLELYSTTPSRMVISDSSEDDLPES